MENLIVVETGKSFEDVCRALERAIADHRFGVLHIHDMQQALANKGITLGRSVRVFDVCNPQQAKQALEEAPLVAAARPCAIAIIAEGDRTKFAVLRPTVVLGLFQTPGLRLVAEEVERTVRAIVDQPVSPFLRMCSGPAGLHAALAGVPIPARRSLANRRVS